MTRDSGEPQSYTQKLNNAARQFVDYVLQNNEWPPDDEATRILESVGFHRERSPEAKTEEDLAEDLKQAVLQMLRERH